MHRRSSSCLRESSIYAGCSNNLGGRRHGTLHRLPPVQDDSVNEREIDEAMAGNLCRCATYTRIRAGIHRAAAIGVTAAVTSAVASVVTAAATGKGKQ